MTYQYLIEELIDQSITLVRLNQLGTDGWKLIHVGESKRRLVEAEWQRNQSVYANVFTYTFVKEIEPAPAPTA